MSRDEIVYSVSKEEFERALQGVYAKALNAVRAFASAEAPGFARTDFYGHRMAIP